MHELFFEVEVIYLWGSLNCFVKLFLIDMNFNWAGSCTAGQIVHPNITTDPEAPQCLDCEIGYYQAVDEPKEEECIKCPDTAGGLKTSTMAAKSESESDCLREFFASFRYSALT